MCPKDLFKNLLSEKAISFPHILEAISSYKERHNLISVDSKNQKIEVKQSMLPKEDFISLKHIEEALGKLKDSNPFAKLTLADKIFLYRVLNEYNDVLSEMKECNDSLMDEIFSDIDKAVEEDDAKKAQEAKKVKFTDEQMANFNLVQNKKFLAKAEVNSYDRMTIYNTIKEWFVKVFANTKDNTKTRTVTLEAENYRFEIMAKFGTNGEQLYKIKSVEHKRKQ